MHKFSLLMFLDLKVLKLHCIEFKTEKLAHEQLLEPVMAILPRLSNLKLKAITSKKGQIDFSPLLIEMFDNKSLQTLSLVGLNLG